MKGTEKIIAHIMADAQAQADAIIAQAEEKGAAIRSEYEARAKEKYNSLLRAGVKSCEDRVDSMNRIAKMEARKGVLALKQEMVGQSFLLAREKLVTLPEDEYVRLLAKLADEAAVTGDEEIILNVRDRESVGEKTVAAANAALTARGLPGKLRLSDRTGDFVGGLILKRGSIEVNCTAELLVELQRSEMSAQLANLLFE